MTSLALRRLTSLATVLVAVSLAPAPAQAALERVGPNDPVTTLPLYFQDTTGITFELATVLDRQKKFAESEALFRQLLSKEPDNAPALNYLGYMLAERGERLDESVDYIKRALALDPDNGSYLDSIGWAYYKDGKFDMALEHLQRAAQMLTTNSVVQDHYADVLFRLGRYDDAIAAWTKALSGDLDSIDRGDIDKKIRNAKQKLTRK